MRGASRSDYVIPASRPSRKLQAVPGEGFSRVVLPPIISRGDGVSLVNLNAPAEAITSGPHHSAPKLVQPSPGRLVAAQAQHPLQSQCTRPVLLAGEPPHGSKPTLERLAGVLRLCLLSPKLDARSLHTAAAPCAPPRFCHARIADNENPPASGVDTDTPDRPAR